ncbi:uncharacterized protein CELE_K08D8.10 [Caenorhabditis elegans]|uniref:Transmembrane protein n=1 Tax=Caenorhabditis elegans TaxID=6239 RepID=D3KFU7_CAEEL|nr:Transmembrane protein [Caenorhabditis elegans]CBJ25084.1 Transmembrane protein [Caenorhabditis elegans]|eukprot:NP_001255686.1 Uncharacterized protein CELE_K08D8.10 [Caenorhabditis elegans]
MNIASANIYVISTPTPYYNTEDGLPTYSEALEASTSFVRNSTSKRKSKSDVFSRLLLFFSAIFIVSVFAAIPWFLWLSS